MYGAIIGDLIGSIYEYDEFIESGKNIVNIERRRKILTKKELITFDSFYSDDTILTIAILDSILNNIGYKENLKKYCLNNKSNIPLNRPYFKYMFSPGFIKWCNNNEIGTSIGNGAMMRISPIGYLFDNEEEILKQARLATIPSHNSALAIQSAQIVSLIIYLGRRGLTKEEIYNVIKQRYNLDLNFSLEELQTTNKFDGTCAVLPKLLFILFSCISFEDCMRKCISIGGDTDTNACIVGSMAEVIYGIPSELIEQVNEKIPFEYRGLLQRGYSKIKRL